jgi:hypothetical protein
MSGHRGRLFGDDLIRSGFVRPGAKPGRRSSGMTKCSRPCSKGVERGRRRFGRLALRRNFKSGIG